MSDNDDTKPPKPPEGAPPTPPAPPTGPAVNIEDEMRNSEARRARIGEVMLEDIDKEPVDFVLNYDGQEREPTVLPPRFPTLLVNGSAGIGVGMATNIPPHNRGEVIDGTIPLIDTPAV